MNILEKLKNTVDSIEGMGLKGSMPFVFTMDEQRQLIAAIELAEAMMPMATQAEVDQAPDNIETAVQAYYTAKYKE